MKDEKIKGKASVNHDHLTQRDLPYDFGTAVLQQNLNMQKSSLTIEGNLTVENVFSGGGVTVEKDIVSEGPISGGEGISARNAALGETLVGGVEVVDPGVSGHAKVYFENIHDPVSRYDALTWGYFRGCAAESLSCYSTQDRQIPAGLLHTLPMFFGSQSRILSPKANDCFEWEESRLFLKKIGFYQVSINVERVRGRHSGNDEQDLWLNLHLGDDVSYLGYTDTRGLSKTDATVRTVYGVFSVLSTYNDPRSVWVDMTFNGDMLLRSVAVNAVWFPLNIQFLELD